MSEAQCVVMFVNICDVGHVHVVVGGGVAVVVVVVMGAVEDSNSPSPLCPPLCNY